MNEELKQRLNKVIPRLESQEFLDNAGLGNEIGFYIFDYPPEEELAIREYMDIILAHFATKRPDLKVIHINLFKLIIGHLENRNLLEKSLKLQKEKGDEALRTALAGPLNEEKLAKVFVEAADPDNSDIVIVSGVGNSWPLLRSHTLLNNLHPLMSRTPLVMFYPGIYDGQSLKLFGRLKDDNYYRAFRLIT